MRRLGIVVAALCATVALAVPASSSALERPSPGAAGIGDRLFPTLGNGGYDVLHYDLDRSGQVRPAPWPHPRSCPSARAEP